MLEKETKGEYIPSLYMNSSCTPPRADEMIEKGLIAFKNEIETQLTRRKPNRQLNLTYYQQHALKQLHSRNDIHICDSDTNLGPTAVTTTKYKQQMYVEHLNTPAYKRLTEEDATKINDETKIMIRRLFNEKCGIAKA
jgi:ABC-type uncharacterized transport system ATPase subunit